MPKKSKKKIIITSALPYVNNIPHLGTLLCIISADAYARFLRLKKENLLFICGTDEHGTTAEVKALEETLTPKQLVDKYFKIHKKIYEEFNCSFDCFGRTSSNKNKKITTNIFKKLDRHGFIVEYDLEQAFCEKCNKFLADRFIEGKCPYCGYENARGDQCENCGKLLNATELINAKCKICGSKPITKKSKNLFIDLPKLEPELRKWIKKAEKGWSTNAITITDSWLREGLKPRCITRDIKWGIKVPKKGFKDKVFYSWFDAPIGYISITAEKRKDWRGWWLDKKTRLVQFMGKDNIPFHTILFPASLIGTKEPYVLVSDLSVNEFLNYESGQFSKSLSRGVFADDALSTKIKADIWRYYLLINRPEKTDTEFSWTDFQAKINNELVANLGNFIYRTSSFINRFFKSKIPNFKLSEEDKKFLKTIKESEIKINEFMETISLKDALKEIMHISKLANNHFQKNEPWRTFKENKKKAETTICTLANVVKDLSILIGIFMPDIADEIKDQLNIKKIRFSDLGKVSLKNHKIKKAKILFKKLEDKEVAYLRRKYGGKKEQEKEVKKNKEKFPLNLKVAEIMEVKDHPDADKLLTLEINLGKEKRQLVAGLKPYYSKDELLNKKIVIVANLQPAVLRGIKSEGMLLAAQDKNNVGLLTAEKSNAGDSVYFDDLINDDKEISFDDFKKIKMTVSSGKVLYKNKIMKTDKEDIIVEKVGDGAQVL